VIECVVEGSQPELWSLVGDNEHYKRVYTKNLLWHKEALLNSVIRELPKKYKYVFWVDADVIFTNKNWLVDAVKVLKTENIVQPFEYCVHLEQDTMEPRMNIEFEKTFVSDPKRRHPRLWRSFAANYATNRKRSEDVNYDVHGHVGFAWGARREIIDTVPLYDKALVGGADHIIAHAAAGQINHNCITKAFKETTDEIESWSRRFHYIVNGRIGYVEGDLHHIWHGDITKRQYLKRVQEFTPQTKAITKKDSNGLYETDDDSYVKDYFIHREVKPDNIEEIKEVFKSAIAKDKAKKITANRDNTPKHVYYEKRAELQNMYPDRDDTFIDSIIWGYITDSAAMGTVMGGNPLGAIIGDMLNDNDQKHIDIPASESFDPSKLDDTAKDPSDSTDYTTSDNFS
jgi:hypothetical protein